jgi:HSP20 family protein
MPKTAKSSKGQAIEAVPVRRTPSDLLRPDLFSTLFSPFRWPLGGLMEESWPTSLLERSDRLLTPLTDVHETPDALIVSVELPGLAKKDVKVQVEDNVLTISGEKKSESREEKGECVRMERRYGSFHRSLTLPPSIDPSAVKARMGDGVLTIEVAKRETARPKAVPID